MHLHGGHQRLSRVDAEWTPQFVSFLRKRALSRMQTDEHGFASKVSRRAFQSLFIPHVRQSPGRPVIINPAFRLSIRKLSRWFQGSLRRHPAQACRRVLYVIEEM